MERAKLDIEHLQDDVKELKDEIKEMRKDQKTFNDFMILATQQIAHIAMQLKALQDGGMWIKRLIIGALITGSITGIYAFLSWAIQN